MRDREKAKVKRGDTKTELIQRKTEKEIGHGALKQKEMKTRICPSGRLLRLKRQCKKDNKQISMTIGQI